MKWKSVEDDLPELIEHTGTYTGDILGGDPNVKIPYVIKKSREVFIWVEGGFASVGYRLEGSQTGWIDSVSARDFVVTHWMEIVPPKPKDYVDPLKSHPCAIPGPKDPKKDSARVRKLLDEQRTMLENLMKWRPDENDNTN